MRIREGEEWKAGFQTNRGMFKPLVMFFGLRNSPVTFQMMMNDIFADLIQDGLVCIYMDNILIFAQTRQNFKPLHAGFWSGFIGTSYTSHCRQDTMHQFKKCR